MSDSRIHLENVLNTLRKIATVNPTQMAIYITEINAILQVAPIDFTNEDMKWFNEQVDNIIDVYMGGRLFRDDEYASCRETLN